MADIPDKLIETEARALLWETIQRSGWYPHLAPEDRDKRIDEDVDRNWHLMIPDARKRIEDRMHRKPDPNFA